MPQELPPLVSAQQPPSPKSNSNRACLIVGLGCAGVFVLAGILLFATCIGAGVWLSKEAEVLPEGFLITGDEETYVSVYFDNQDRALLDLIVHWLTEMEAADRTGNEPSFLDEFNQGDMRSELGQALPARCHLSVRPSESTDENDVVISVELARNFRLYQVMLKTVLAILSGTPGYEEITVGEYTISVFDDADDRIAVANVEHRFHFGSANMVEQVLENNYRFEKVGPPEKALSALDRVSYQDSPFWGYFLDVELVDPGSFDLGTKIEVMAISASLSDSDQAIWTLAAVPVNAGDLNEETAALAGRSIDELLASTLSFAQAEVTYTGVESDVLIVRGQIGDLRDAMSEMARLSAE